MRDGNDECLQKLQSLMNGVRYKNVAFREGGKAEVQPIPTGCRDVASTGSPNQSSSPDLRRDGGLPRRVAPTLGSTDTTLLNQMLTSIPTSAAPQGPKRLHLASRVGELEGLRSDSPRGGAALPSSPRARSSTIHRMSTAFFQKPPAAVVPLVAHDEPLLLRVFYALLIDDVLLFYAPGTGSRTAHHMSGRRAEELERWLAAKEHLPEEGSASAAVSSVVSVVSPELHEFLRCVVSQGRRDKHPNGVAQSLRFGGLLGSQVFISPNCCC